MGAMEFDSRDRALRGRIGGYSKAAKFPANELTCGARAGFLKRFEPTDPDLRETERQRRTECSLKAIYGRSGSAVSTGEA